ncbi:outer membrane beta-barrel protein [Paraglaciecola chathamensis]|uniref:Outer membrane beta-barrel protein n=1 Tax=Paraglaciecola chathamensis TaxID=368405 RepID=A0ABS0WAE7_9ALTE|nr:outer membrane beta-barrel protein [Paraglaciecola chathamensis]MBJ2135095.1 outer membrane beta-barrel protein [Paraglaciecola chathamensis]
MSKTKLATAIGMACVCSSSFAQEEVGIDLGAFELVPTLTTTVGFNDNVTRSRGDDEEIDSWFSAITPRFTLVNNFGLNSLRFGYQLTRGDYFSSSADDYTDHLLFASLDYELNSRHRTKTSINFEDGHDDRGEAFSRGRGNELDSPDEFKESEVDFTYSYGALSALARLDVNLNYRDLDYKIDTNEYKARDRSKSSIGGTFYYKVGPVTDLTFDAEIADVKYSFLSDGATTFDSIETSYLIGARWQSTASTSGYAKIGYQNKNFDAASRNSFSGLKWEGGIVWEPLERATFILDTQNEARETNGDGDFIRRKDISLRWRHEWLQRLRTDAGVTVGNDDYEGSGRKDDISELNLAVTYEFRRWLTFNLGYTYSERDSNQNVIDYDGNIYRLTAKVTL